MKSTTGKYIIRSVIFMVIFCILLSIITIVFIPKRNGTSSESGQVAGFYEEPDGTLDVLFLGSCNMYSSVSPVLIYEKYGITGYAMCCPDQEMSTSYHFIKEALKTQNIKVVVIESLFLTATNTQKREHYNRFALDYMPLSLNKIEMAWNLSGREVEHMKQYDNTTPDRLLTFAGYMFPLLRYHARDDIDFEDFSDYFVNNKYNYYKGGFPQYTYTYNDNLFWDKVFNGNEINEISKKYVPMIKELCDTKGIQLVLVKSPNYARWGYDDTYTSIVRNYANELGIPFIDCQDDKNNTYEEWDYGFHTGRLNIYGVQKFSDTIGAYLAKQCGLNPTYLSDKDKKAWDESVKWYYEKAEEKNCSITPGQLAQVCNREGSIRIRWNMCEDCETYSIYRCKGKNGKYKLITDCAKNGCYYDDNVVALQGYSYYVVPNKGKLSGQKSQVLYYVYIDVPQNLTVKNINGALQIKWDSVNGATNYRIQRRLADDLNFDYYDSTTKTSYLNKAVSDGKVYYYRVSAAYKEDDVTYYSMTTIERGMPQKTPMISSVTVQSGKAKITWNKITNQTDIQIWRRSEDEKSFTRIATVKANTTSFTDEGVKAGNQYFYKIISRKTAYGFKGVSEESNTVGVKIPK